MNQSNPIGVPKFDDPQGLTEIHANAEVRKTRWIGTLRPKPGQKVWRLNVSTGVIDPAPMDVQLSVIGKKIKNIKIDPGCLYCCAINKTNADKHFVTQLEKILK